MWVGSASLSTAFPVTFCTVLIRMMITMILTCKSPSISAHSTTTITTSATTEPTTTVVDLSTIHSSIIKPDESFKVAVIQALLDVKPQKSTEADVNWATNDVKNRKPRHIAEKSSVEIDTSPSSAAKTYHIRIVNTAWKKSEDTSDEDPISKVSDERKDVQEIERIIHRRHGEHPIRHLHHNRHVSSMPPDRKKREREQFKGKKVMNLVKPKEGFECPTRSKNRMKDHVTAVTIEEICDGTPHCPNEEDEDPTAYKRIDGTNGQGPEGPDRKAPN
ncbi:unnamed protein product [Enterobius vermicularis]|uniref:Circumsporozoite protein n=1 Tax=Enterobius vermicularis TaxID=51028 RepID=A0A0N4V4Q7_ENTVE|nr:unnamed protein product [Enterobius vermicularis]